MRTTCAPLVYDFYRNIRNAATPGVEKLQKAVVDEERDCRQLATFAVTYKFPKWMGSPLFVHYTCFRLAYDPH